MKKIISLLGLITLLSSQVVSQDYFFRHYSTENGLNNPFINSLNQDSDGYIWIGTAEGLNRFDGFVFEHFTSEDGLSEDYISMISRDRNKNLWFGHRNGDVTVLKDNEFIIPSGKRSINGLVVDIEEDNEGLIWVVLQNQCIYYVNQEMIAIEVSHNFKSDPLTTILSIGEDYFLIASEEEITLCHFEKQNNSIAEILSIDKLPLYGVTDLLPMSDNSFLLLTKDEGIFTLNLEKDLTNYTLSAIEGLNVDNAEGLQNAIIDKNGFVWVSSMGEGLFKFRKSENNSISLEEHINEDRGLVSSNIKTIFEDIEGNLWIGLYGMGLLKYVDNNIKIFSFGQESESNIISSIYSDSKSTYLFNNDNILEISPPNDSIINAGILPANLSNDRVTSSFLDKNNILWIGFANSGLYSTNPKQLNLKRIFLSNDDLSNSINSITGDDTDIWVSTKKGVYNINLETGSKKWFTSEDGLPHNNIQQVYPDSKGRILIATVCSELHYINNNDEIQIVESSRFGSITSIVSILESDKGHIFAATSGSGIWKINTEENLNYTRNSGLVSDFCYGMTSTDDGKIIVTHRGGISEINTNTNRIKTYGRLEGIKSSMEFYPNVISKDIRRNIWFGTSEGALAYLSDLSGPDNLPPILRISSIEVNGEEIPADSLIVLNAGQYEIGIEFMGINFSNPEMVSYQTFLEGYNQRWSELSANRKVVFNRVAHGRYTFNLRAFDENDSGSQISSGFQLQIKKPFVLSFWFYAILIVFIALIFYFIIRIREQRHRLEQEGLLKNLDEKTKDIIVKEEIIKARKKVEKELIEAKTKAEMAEELKSSFLANMSHEIRTPMNAIVGMSHLLKEDGDDPVSRNELVNEIIGNSESLLTMISDILDVSKLETKQLKICNSSFSVNELLGVLSSKLKEDLQQKNKDYINIDIIEPEENIELISDKHRLEQILRKLLDNAVKYTEQGSIKLGCQVNKKDKNIFFYVEDTGIGLSEEKMDVIFDLFRKIEDDKLKLYRGTGLGLTLARYLVKLLGGDINVESIEGKGSKFYFVLPLVLDKDDSVQPELLAEKHISDYNWIGKKILIVEDDDTNFDLLKYILRKTQIELIRSTDGESAISIFAKDKDIDLIIMDIKLPGIDGIEATRKIRELDKNIPIISHTAYALEGEKEKSIAAGCNEYITKPTNQPLLLSTINKLLSKS